VSGFAHAGFQLTADRYSYLPGMAAAPLVGAAVGGPPRRSPGQARGGRRARGDGLVGGLAILTSRQVSVWRNPEGLWGQALRVDPACAICHDYLGGWLMRQHRNLEGFEQLRHAAALRPGRFMASGRLGQAHEQLGLLPEAIAAYWQELAVRPAAPEARMRLGGALAKAGQPAAALEELEGALSAGWASPDLWINLGLALDSLGRYREAIDRFGQALQASPRNAVAVLGLARSHLHLGQKELARADYETLKELDPISRSGSAGSSVAHESPNVAAHAVGADSPRRTPATS